MHALVRTYTGRGAKELFDVLEQKKTEVEKLIRGVKGVKHYLMVRTGDGGFSVTVCDDKAGTDESVKVARDFITQNGSHTGAGAPRIEEGQVILHIG